jgi:SAM-dependent methyltransferase
MNRTRLAATDLRAAWETHADRWIAWAREPEHDTYWRFHRDTFLDLVPDAGPRTLDLGCGEGRLSRDLTRLGHKVAGVDVSPAMIRAARSSSSEIPVCVGDAAALPFGDDTFDLVVAFMSLQDVDMLDHAIQEAARVLTAGGRFCLAVVHPLNSAGSFADESAHSPFVIEDSYLDQSLYADDLARDGLEMTFVSAHRPMQAYTDALAHAGLLIDRVREPAAPDHAFSEDRGRRWQRVPLFLHLRALKV